MMNSWRSISIFGSLAVAFIIGVFVLFSCVEWLDAKHVMVIQYPDGSMATFADPGPKPQWFGTATVYPRRAQYAFNNSPECTQAEKGAYAPFKIRFNEGGHGVICGAVSWEMPTSRDQLIRLQKDFGSAEAIESQLVSKVLNNAVYFSGQLMSSTESSNVRRAELLQYIEDQAKHGVYQTQARPEKIKDPITGVEKTISVVEITKDAKGIPMRNTGSAIGDYGITLVQTSISDIPYEKVVEDQIRQQQQANTQVQIAIANSKRAEQEALTTAKQGEANAAKAKWDQETIKAKEVTAAQQRLEVAQLGAKEAEQLKQREILLGQGEGERKRLVMSADGALDKKLEAIVKINEMYANAIKDYKGNWVPNVQMGDKGGANQGLALIDLLTAKTARDLGMDMSVAGKGNTSK